MPVTMHCISKEGRGCWYVLEALLHLMPELGLGESGRGPDCYQVARSLHGSRRYPANHTNQSTRGATPLSLGVRLMLLLWFLHLPATSNPPVLLSCADNTSRDCDFLKDETNIRVSNYLLDTHAPSSTFRTRLP